MAELGELGKSGSLEQGPLVNESIVKLNTNQGR